MSPVDHAAIVKAKPILGRISLVLSCSTLAEVLDYSWFFDSVFDLLEGIFLLMSPDPLAFLCVRRRSGSYISERFCRNLDGYRTSPNNLCAADTLLVAPSWLLHSISCYLPSIYSSSSQVQWMALCFIWIQTSPFSAWWILPNYGLALLLLKFVYHP